MSRLNPIYILALILTISIISFVLLNDKKEEFKVLNTQYTSLSIKAKDFNAYKQNWYDKKRIIKKLDSILKSSTFRKEKILRTQTDNIIKVKIESKNPITLNKFLNRVLNEKFRFKKIDIKKRSIYFEIGLK